MAKDRPVARFALGFGFATAPTVEPTLDLAAVVASTPEQQRIRIVGGTEIEDRLSLRGLSAAEISNGPLLTASSSRVGVGTLGTAVYEPALDAVDGYRVVVNHHPTTRSTMVNAR